jgi:alpha-L-rhamnosidase
VIAAITHLIYAYRTNPLGIDITAPCFGQQMQTRCLGARQIAYRIMAASDSLSLREGKVDLWDTGRIDSDQSVQVTYAGKSLTSRQRVYWNVTVWDETGTSTQSATAWFELGLLARDEWKGEWVKRQGLVWLNNTSFTKVSCGV